MDQINKILHGLIIEYTKKPATRQQLKAPIIGCRYSMIISFCYYTYSITDINTITYIISHPLLDNLINGTFVRNDGTLINIENSILNVLSTGNRMYPFVLVMQGNDNNLYINHYFNIEVSNNQFFIHNSYGSDYISSPYQKKQIENDITILNLFDIKIKNNQKLNDVIHFFIKYFIPNGLTTYDSDSKTFYKPPKGIQAEIDHFQRVNILGIFYLHKLTQQISDILQPHGGSPYKSNKKKKTNKKRKSNKKKKSNKRKKSIRK